MSQDISLQIETLQQEADSMSGEARGQRLGEAALLGDQGGLESAEVARLYLEAVDTAPENAHLYWSVGRAIKSPETHALISAGLSERAESEDAQLIAHASMFKSCHIEADRRLDSALRDLVRKHPDAHLWQAYRFVELDKWRNVQQVFAEQVGGDPMSARAEAARLTAYFAKRLGAETSQLAEKGEKVRKRRREMYDESGEKDVENGCGTAVRLGLHKHIEA